MLKVISVGLVLSGALSLSPSPLRAGTIAVIGDSISTGGASHSALAFDIEKMETVFNGQQKLDIDPATRDFLSREGITPPLTPPQRLGLSPREFTHPLVWIFNNFVTSMSTQYLDMEEYSWGYLLSRFHGDTILIAARDGEKSFQARQQVDRILDNAKDQSLDQVFIFFTGNDICAADPALITTRDEYTQNIGTAVRYLIKNARPKLNGGITHIWLMDPLGVSQLATSPEILSKRIPAFGAEHSCRELQSDEVNKGFISKQTDDASSLGMRAILSQIFQGGPYGLCPSLFAYHKTGTLEDLMPVSNALASYREGLIDLVKELDTVNPAYRVHQLNAPSTLMFAAEDIGNDCFHLSVRGHMKIAKAIREEMRTRYSM